MDEYMETGGLEFLVLLFKGKVMQQTGLEPRNLQNHQY